MALWRLPAPKSLEAITKLFDLEVLAEDFTTKSGLPPELPSHWDPKPIVSAEIESWLPLPPHKTSLVEYTYPCDVRIDQRVLDRIGEDNSRGVLLTPSGTTSVVNVCCYLRNVGIQSLVVVTPAYFTVEAVAELLDLSCSFAAVAWRHGKYELPALKQGGPQTAIWFTFPVYGASYHFKPEEIAAAIDELPEETVVVVDESLSYPDRRTLSATKTLKRVIRICTPHKALCVNGEKISFVTFPRHLSDGMDAWSDCFAGGLGAAGVRALAFVASDQFDQAVGRARALVRNKLELLKGVASISRNIQMDSDSDGYFVTLYWPMLPASLGQNESFLISLLNESHALPIPSIRNRQPEECGFCFRTNLFRLDEAGLGGISRLIQAIDRRV